METEYIVVWNGSHAHMDCDLLCAVRVPEKVTPQPKPLSPGAQLFTTRLALLLRHRKLTRREIIQELGATVDTVNNALYRLRSRGLLRSAPVGGAAWTTTTQRHYWLARREAA